jgi:hypothetical protein
MSVLIRTLVGSLEVVANLGSANRLTVRSLTLLKKTLKKDKEKQRKLMSNAKRN